MRELTPCSGATFIGKRNVRVLGNRALDVHDACVVAHDTGIASDAKHFAKIVPSDDVRVPHEHVRYVNYASVGLSPRGDHVLVAHDEVLAVEEEDGAWNRHWREGFKTPNAGGEGRGPPN